MTEWTPQALVNLRSILANLYPLIGDGLRLAGDAELTTAHIAFSDKAINSWSAILTRAKHEGKVEVVVALAVAENPNNEDLKAARNGAPPPPVEGPAPGQWAGTISRGQLEKIIGPKSTLVSISYLELGLERAKSVGRVRLADGSSGTGFVVANATLITNNHVLPDKASAAGAKVQFNYQHTVAGRDAPMEQLDLAPEEFFRTSIDDDWTAVRIAGDVSKWGALEMKPAKVKAGDHVNIIQHPGGGHKQISFVANIVAYVGGDRVQYLTDTLPGSSGSPVFDTGWNLVALHHSGGWLEEPQAPAKSTYYRNRASPLTR